MKFSTAIIFSIILGCLSFQTYSYVLSKIGAVKTDYTCNTEDEYNEMVPAYIINLDLPIAMRWDTLINKYLKELITLSNFTKSLIGSYSHHLIQPLISLIGKRLPEEQKTTLTAFSMLTGIPYNDIVLFNTFYEFFTVCTSIIAVNPDGVLYHARNLDFGVFMGFNTSSVSWKLPDILRAMTVKLIFQKNSVTVAESISFVGYLGAITGMKPNGFSLSMNERFKINGGYVGLIEWLVKKSDAKFIGFLTLDILLNAKNYQEAKELFQKYELIAPTYIILGSNETQGCVITRDRKATVDTWEIDLKNNVWYLLQTNYDHTDTPPFFDDRVSPGNFCMNKMGRENISEKQLYNVLRTKPLRNMLTVYTAIMIPSKGHLNAYFQTCPFPCPPW